MAPHNRARLDPLDVLKAPYRRGLGRVGYSTTAASIQPPPRHTSPS